jgi:hypothetical protein
MSDEAWARLLEVVEAMFDCLYADWLLTGQYWEI